MEKFVRILPVLFLFAVNPELKASLLVDWGGNYVSSNQQYSNPNPSSGISVTQYGGFSGGNPLLLSPSTGYSGTSANFYGEVVRTAGTGTFTNASGSVPVAIVLQNSSIDRLQFRLDGSSMSALFLWKQTDFLNGFDTGTVNLESGSSLNLNLNTNVGTTSGRAVLRAGSSYYISSAFVPAGTTGAVSQDLTTLSWFNYDPASAIGTVGSSFSLVSGGTISNVTEAGFYFSLSGASNAIRLDSVEVNAVPEPSSYFFVLAGGAMLCLLRRQKTHS